jgi:LmbE family N-acetylglucosaminyl deacetylase
MPGGRTSSALHALSLLADPARRPFDASRMVAVFAHPDDETLALGAQLRRMHGLRIVIVTDGAPRSLVDARSHGFEDAAGYAAARKRELAAALAAGGADELDLVHLDVPDQGVAFALAPLAERLRSLVEGADVVLTHAYEGGHPDHDGVAFAVHEAVRMLGESAPPEIVDIPFYRAGDHGEFLAQSFEPVPGAIPVQIVLSRDEITRKQRMLSAHATQRATLSQFSLAAERFRKAPREAFDRLPNQGRLWYERFDWGLGGQAFLERAAEARRVLRRENAA